MSGIEYGTQSKLRPRTGIVLVMFVFLPTACSTTHYRESSDRETYRTITQKSPGVPGMDPAFTIEQEPMPPMEDLPTAAEPAEFLGEAAQSEVGARIVSLERALALAVKHNRDYQNHKETLYLQALSLTGERHRFAPIFSGKMGGDYKRSPRDVTETVSRPNPWREAHETMQLVDQLAGTPADLLAAYAQLTDQLAPDNGPDTVQKQKTVSDWSVEGSTNLGVGLLLQGGAQIAVGLTSSFLRFLTGDPRVSATSALASTITQPLLQGAGRRIAAERLTQAERDLLYQLRDFARYRQELTVRVCSDYYGVLQDRDIVRNNYQSYQSFVQNTVRERAFAAEGMRTQAEVGRLEQALLTNQDSWVNSIRRYKQRLDQFKIALGLPADAPMVLDDNELRLLKQTGIIHPDISAKDATKVALVSRLDLYTQHDRQDDADRKVEVAANALKPRVDVVVTGNVPSRAANRFQELDVERATWTAGLDVDLLLDRKAQRNSYRGALIAADQARRNRELAEDNVKLEVRDSWRNLDQAKRAYEIAQKGVELNARRVEEQDLLAELGRATALNRVDAQNDLTQAENNRTQALVSHTIARLQFWRDMGILLIKPNGQWEEVTDVQ